MRAITNIILRTGCASLKVTLTCEAIAFEIVDIRLMDPVTFSPLNKGIILGFIISVIFLSVIFGPVIICADVDCNTTKYQPTADPITSMAVDRNNTILILSISITCLNVIYVNLQ